MAKSQIKVSINKGAGAGVEVMEHDENGRDVGEVQAIKPGANSVLNVTEGHSFVIQRGEVVVDGKQSLIATISVEKDSTHNARVQLRSGIADLADVTVTPKEAVDFTLEGEPRIRITRGTANPDRVQAEKAPKKEE